MLNKIILDAPQTRKYYQYIFSEIAKLEPLTSGEVVDIEIDESETQMPKLREIPMPKYEKPAVEIGQGGVKIFNAIPWTHSTEDIPTQISDSQTRRGVKIDAILEYTKHILHGVCEFQAAEVNDEGPIKAILSFTVIDPKKLYAESKLEHNPLRICFAGKEYRILEGTIQSRLCELIFDKPLNTIFETDTLVDAVYNPGMENPKDKWKNINNALGAINRKIKLATQIDIFHTGKLRFSRIH